MDFFVSKHELFFAEMSLEVFEPLLQYMYTGDCTIQQEIAHDVCVFIAATKWNCLNIWPFDWKVKDGATFLGLNDLADLLAPVLEKLPKPDASSAPKPKRARKILEEATVPMILRDQLGDATPVTAQPQKQTPATRRTTTSSSPFVNNRTQTDPK